MTSASKAEKDKRIPLNRMNLRVGDLNDDEIERVLDMDLCFNPMTKKWDGGYIDSDKIRYFVNKEGILALPLGEVYSVEIIKSGLTSLHNMPATVITDFDVSNNYITDIDDAPTDIGGNLDLSNNKITSLEPLTSTLKVIKFDCKNNNLTDLKGCPGVIETLECSNNPLTSLKGLPEPNTSSTGVPEMFTLTAHKTRLKNYVYMTTIAFNISSLYRISEVESKFVRMQKITNQKDQTKKMGNYTPNLDEREYYNELASFMVEAGLHEIAEEIWWHEDVKPNIQNLFGSVKTINKFNL